RPPAVGPVARRAVVRHRAARSGGARAAPRPHPGANGRKPVARRTRRAAAALDHRPSRRDGPGRGDRDWSRLRRAPRRPRRVVVPRHARARDRPKWTTHADLIAAGLPTAAAPDTPNFRRHHNQGETMDQPATRPPSASTTLKRYVPVIAIALVVVI